MLVSVLAPSISNVKIKFLISAARTCDNLEAQIADSVIVSGYTDPAVEGTTVTFHCSPRLVYLKDQIHRHVWRMGNGNQP